MALTSPVKERECVTYIPYFNASLAILGMEQFNLIFAICKRRNYELLSSITGRGVGSRPTQNHLRPGIRKLAAEQLITLIPKSLGSKKKTALVNMNG